MRVLAINDVSCVGRCSLTASLPIISACGVECNVLPTALLSTHTGGFQGYTFRDLTADINGILAHWKTLGIQFDFIYSGYLGSIEQIALVEKVKADFLAENGIFVVDPVMGDDGSLYTGFTQDYVNAMRELCKQADYILPNVTEACYLADVPYPLSEKTVENALSRLKAFTRAPIITGVKSEKGISVCFTDKTDKTLSFTHENLEGFFCGAGDVFASAFVGCLARGKTETEAVRLASDFVAACINRSAKEVPDKRFGLNFETEIFTFLKKLNS